jgi:hypothetical protein
MWLGLDVTDPTLYRFPSFRAKRLPRGDIDWQCEPIKGSTVADNILKAVYLYLVHRSILWPRCRFPSEPEQ